jgi:hypothetical protein
LRPLVSDHRVFQNTVGTACDELSRVEADPDSESLNPLKLILTPET